MWNRKQEVIVYGNMLFVLNVIAVFCVNVNIDMTIQDCVMFGKKKKYMYWDYDGY